MESLEQFFPERIPFASEMLIYLVGLFSWLNPMIKDSV